MAQRKKHTAQFKAKVAIEALKERKTANQIASEYQVHAAQISQWKKAAIEILQEGFSDKTSRKRSEEGEFTQDQLFSQIGQLKMELDWLKKKSDLIS